jgi:glycine dehydrogenase subunit 1
VRGDSLGLKERRDLNKPHPYLPTSAPEIKRKMLKELDLESINDLYSDIPEPLRFNGSLDIPGPYAESKIREIVENALEKNEKFVCQPFLGGGVWPHYVPAAVDEIVQRAEFLTSYTPYQPEISQGMLQALFEYQSLICELVGLDVVNSSMYDWASALGEAARMASRLTQRNEFIVPSLIHPERLQVLKAYAEPAGIKVIQADYDHETGQMNLEDLARKVSKNTAAVYIENPSYLGFVEERVSEISDIAHGKGALFVAGVDPISLGLLRSPGDYGADIVVGEGQPLGNHMNYGGPLLGILACRGDLGVVKQMPGRIVGLTRSLKEGERGFCITLQTREQHIRRERATSNICTNEALCAVAGAVYLSLLGPKGLRDLCEVIVSHANYAMRRLSEVSGIRAPLFKAFHFKEFTVQLEAGQSYMKIHEKLLRRKIHGGKYIGEEFPQLGETALFCVTESHAKEDIDLLVASLKEVLLE